MTRRAALDPGLGPVFRVRDALDAGATPDRLGAHDLKRPFHGVRTLGDLDAVRSYVPRLREHDRFSHTTAAMLWGAPLPRERDGELHVSTEHGTRPRARGCIGHVTSSPGAVVRRGVPVSSPAQTLVECATLLTVDELVAVADFLVLDPRRLDPDDIRPHVARDALGEQLEGLRGAGVRAARRAHAMCRDGVESPMETRLRLLLVRGGIPEPTCGFEVRRSNGSTVGWFDLAWPERRVIVEYDGDQHRTSTAQYDRDIRRFDDAAALGWTVLRVRKRGVFAASADTVSRVSTALRRT
jgi:very-short-patch-repair endonuclease